MVEDTETTVGMVEDMVNLAVVVGLEAATSPDTVEDTNTKAIVEAMDQDTVVVLVSLETVVVMVNLDMVVGKAAATTVARVDDITNTEYACSISW
jgi:radical SAM superfamily enzyme